MTYGKRTVLAAAAAACLITLSMLRAQDAAPATAPSTSPAATQPLPSAQAVIDRYIEATGGKEAYASIKSRHLEAEYQLADLGIHGKLVADIRSDGKARIWTEIPNVDKFTIGVTDGIVWKNDQTGGPRILSGVMAQSTLESMQLTPEISLEPYKSAEVTEMTDLNDVNVYKMVLKYKSIDAVETRYYEVKTGLLLRTDGVVPTDMGNIVVTTRYMDYEDAVPIRMAMKTRQSMSGLSPEQVNTKVEHNVEIPDEVFALPPEVQELLKHQAATQPAK